MDSVPCVLTVDIGTTTIDAAVYRQQSESAADRNRSAAVFLCPEPLAAVSERNRQSVFGADVVTRLSFVLQEDSPNRLQRLSAVLKEQLLHIAGCLLSEISGIAGRCEIRRIVLTGNTVMLHFLTKKDISGLAFSPFTPASLFGYELSAGALWDSCPFPDMPVYLPPCVSAYVGADTVCAMLACRFDRLLAERSEKKILLADIGTNAEIALYSGGTVRCTSAAAGPAFEKGLLHKGLSGSAVVRLVADMLAAGAVDKSGLLCGNNAQSPAALPPAVLTQAHMRQIQLAKSAVSAAVKTLLHETESSDLSGIDAYCICGAFGNSLDFNAAATVGLVPPELTERIVLAGNAALAGALLLSDPALRSAAAYIAAHACHLELADSPFFSETFIKDLNFL